MSFAKNNAAHPSILIRWVWGLLWASLPHVRCTSRSTPNCKSQVVFDTPEIRYILVVVSDIGKNFSAFCFRSRSVGINQWIKSTNYFNHCSKKGWISIDCFIALACFSAIWIHIIGPTIKGSYRKWLKSQSSLANYLQSVWFCSVCLEVLGWLQRYVSIPSRDPWWDTIRVHELRVVNYISSRGLRAGWDRNNDVFSSGIQQHRYKLCGSLARNQESSLKLGYH